MKVTLLYGRRKVVMDVGENDTIGNMKVYLRDKFNLNIQSSHEREDLILHITYAGSYLHDDWILSDIGVLPGSTLQCILQSRDKIFLRVFSSFNSKYYEFTEPINVDKTTVETLKSMVQDQSGIPVSMFRLCRKQSEKEMYDARFLGEYNVRIGDTVYLDVWDGMGDFLLSAFAGDVTATMHSVVSFHEDPFLYRYQLRVALFIAAFQGNIQLAAHFLKTGSRCDEPVGEHPARDWCKSVVAHPFSLRTPAHAAAQCGRISCLRLFIHHNRACILAKDGHGSTPTAVARRYGQRECFKLLVAEQFRKVQYAGLNLSIYAKVRKWCDRAKDRVAYYRIDSNNPVLLASLDKSAHSATVGSLIQLSGFGENIQSSANKLNRSKIGAKNQWLWPMREQLVDISRYCDDGKSTRTMFFPALRKQNSRPIVTKRGLRRTSSLDSRSRSTISKIAHRANSKGDSERGILKRTSDLDVLSETEARTDTEARVGVSEQKTDTDPCNCGLYRVSPSKARLPVISQTEREDSTASGGFFITQENASSRRIEKKIKEQHPQERTNSEDSVNAESGKILKKEISPKSNRHLGPPARSFFNPNANKILAFEAHDVIQQATGQTSRQFARSSLELGESFTAMGWLRRLQLASNCSRKTLLRGMQDKARAKREDDVTVTQ